MSIPLKARVHLEIDGEVYVPGQWITLLDGQQQRAQSLVTYGLAEEAPAQPVKPRVRRSSSRS